MKFAFIVHPRNTWELRKMILRYQAPIFPLGKEMALKSRCLKKGAIGSYFSFDRVRSLNGAYCSGKIFCVYLAPEQFLEYQSESVKLIREACSQAEEWGATLIGLGAMTGVVGSRGKEVDESSSVAITTGNSLTVYSSLAAFKKIVKDFDLDLSREKIIIVGFPGSIALTLAKILSRKGMDLILVSRRKTPFLKRFLAKLDNDSGSKIEVADSIETALKQGRIVFTATSTGRIIDPDQLAPGTIVFDIAQPRDVIEKKQKRNDILIVDGGIATLPRTNNGRFRFPGWITGDVPACLGETMTLAMEGCKKSYSLGRDLSCKKIEDIGALAENHGFVMDNLRSFKSPIPEECIISTKRALRKHG